MNLKSFKILIGFAKTGFVNRFVFPEFGMGGMPGGGTQASCLWFVLGKLRFSLFARFLLIALTNHTMKEDTAPVHIIVIDNLGGAVNMNPIITAPIKIHIINSFHLIKVIC